MGYTQYLYMRAALGCGPRDTLLVGLSKRLTRIPTGVISIGLLSTATLIGYLLGGPVGIGTMHFEATKIYHHGLQDTLKVMFNKLCIN